MSQDYILKQTRNNPGIEQCRIVNPKTSCNSRQLKTLLKKGLIRREVKNGRYHLYPVEEVNKRMFDKKHWLNEWKMMMCRIHFNSDAEDCIFDVIQYPCERCRYFR